MSFYKQDTTNTIHWRKWRIPDHSTTGTSTTKTTYEPLLLLQDQRAQNIPGDISSFAKKASFSNSRLKLHLKRARSLVSQFPVSFWVTGWWCRQGLIWCFISCPAFVCCFTGTLFVLISHYNHGNLGAFHIGIMSNAWRLHYETSPYVMVLPWKHLPTH